MLTTLQIIGLAFAVAVSACVVGFIALLGYVAWKLDGVRRENEEDAADVRDARERMAEGGTIPMEELGRELNLVINDGPKPPASWFEKQC